MGVNAIRAMYAYFWMANCRRGSKVFLQSPHRKKVPLHHTDSFNAPWFRIKRICSYYDIILMTHEFLMRAVGNITARVNCKCYQEPGRSLFFFLRLLLELVLLANARYACVHTHTCENMFNVQRPPSCGWVGKWVKCSFHHQAYIVEVYARNFIDV